MTESPDPFVQLTADVQADQAATNDYIRRLYASGSKIGNTWQNDLNKLLADATTKLAPLGISFDQGSFKTDKHSVLGFQYPVHGLPQTMNLVIVASEPDVARVSLGHDKHAYIDISGDFPREQFSVAISGLLRQRLLKHAE